MRMKKVKVRLFAGAKDALRTDEVLTQIPVEGTVSDLLRHLEDAYPESIGLLRACRVAVDCRFAGPDEKVPAEAEVALIPPVSGG